SRAIGGAGLVFSEMTDVSREGRISPGCTGIYKPEHITAWKRIVEFIRLNTSSKIGVQLGHAGRKASTQRMWEGMDEPLPEGNWPIISASPLPYFPYSQVPKEMTRADMDEVNADVGAHLGGRLGARRNGAGRFGGGRPHAEGARLRHHGRLGGTDRRRCEAAVRAAISDAVCGPDPSRSRHRHDGGRQHFVVSRC